MIDFLRSSSEGEPKKFVCQKVLVFGLKLKIIVKVFFNLKKAMKGKAGIEVELEHASIRDVLDYLSDRFGKELTDLIIDPDTEELAGHLTLLVNGRKYLFMPNKLDTQLKDGDEIALFPPIAGG